MASNMTLLSWANPPERARDFLTPFKQRKSKATPQFQLLHNFEDRCREAQRIRTKFPDRIPVICERDESCKDRELEEIEKTKYLVPLDISLGQLVFVVRKKISLPPSKALTLFVDGNIPPTAASMSAIYDQYKSDDGFLYVTYTGENTFGGMVDV